MKNVSIISILLVLFILNTNAKAQNSSIWNQCYGGVGDDKAYHIGETSDGGVIMTGYAQSAFFNGTNIGNCGGKDMLIVKVNQSGTVQWQQGLGGANDEVGNVVKELSGGGYLVAGSSTSSGGNVGSSFGGKDVWVVKLDPFGGVVWSKVIGGGGNEEATTIFQTSDGGFFISGYGFSPTVTEQGGAAFNTSNHGNSDVWAAKLDSTGNVQWVKCFGGSMSDRANAAIQHSNGTFVLAGYTESNNGDVSGNHQNMNFFPPVNTQDAWLINIDASGNLLWQKCLGGSNSENANDIKELSNGEIVVAGYSYSSDGDLISNSGMKDVWLLKLSSMGTILWSKSYGGLFDDLAMSVDLLPTGGFLVSGSTNSTLINGVATSIAGYYDFFMMYLDLNGNYQLHATMGGTGWDYGRSLVRTMDGDFIVGGYTNSTNGLFYSNSGSFDFALVKLGGSLLPVELLSFEATLSMNDVLLDWATASEVSNDFFVVEKSENGADFEGIGLVKGKGTSYVTHNYQFIDRNIAAGKWFYRLRQVDMNGNDHFSQTKVVTIGQIRQTSVFPNPAVDMITIAGESAIKRAFITDYAGREYLSVYYGNFSSTERLNVGELPKGTYMLTTIFEDQEVSYTKLIKQ